MSDKPFKMKYTNGKKSDPSSFPFKKEYSQPGDSPNKGIWGSGISALFGGGGGGGFFGGALSKLINRDRKKEEIASSNLSDDAKDTIVAEHVEEKEQDVQQT